MSKEDKEKKKEIVYNTPTAEWIQIMASLPKGATYDQCKHFIMEVVGYARMAESLFIKARNSLRTQYQSIPGNDGRLWFTFGNYDQEPVECNSQLEADIRRAFSNYVPYTPLVYSVIEDFDNGYPWARGPGQLIATKKILDKIDCETTHPLKDDKKKDDKKKDDKKKTIPRFVLFDREMASLSMDDGIMERIIQQQDIPEFIPFDVIDRRLFGSLRANTMHVLKQHSIPMRIVIERLWDQRRREFDSDPYILFTEDEFNLLMHLVRDESCHRERLFIEILRVLRLSTDKAYCDAYIIRVVTDFLCPSITDQLEWHKKV